MAAMPGMQFDGQQRSPGLRLGAARGTARRTRASGETSRLHIKWMGLFERPWRRETTPPARKSGDGGTLSGLSRQAWGSRDNGERGVSRIERRDEHGQ